MCLLVWLVLLCLILGFSELACELFARFGGFGCWFCVLIAGVLVVDCVHCLAAGFLLIVLFSLIYV